MPPEDVRAKYPNLAKFWPYLDLLHKESDRGKVLISTGFIEQQLKEVLLGFMLENKTADELVDGTNAPLGTFSARISASYVLGLISEKEHHDLTLIRRIRNDFAHDIHTSFETSSVIDRCKALRLKAQDYTSEKMGEVVVNAAGQFQTSAVALIMNLTNRPFYVGKQRRVYGDWPY
jgi:hypothetical protein